MRPLPLLPEALPRRRRPSAEDAAPADVKKPACRAGNQTNNIKQ
jgi:hypothetical protein